MQMERLELSRLATLGPKPSASANSATFAKIRTARFELARSSPDLLDLRAGMIDLELTVKQPKPFVLPLDCILVNC